MGMQERPQRNLNGSTLVWIGERAFRATAAVKDQIESIGFLVKVYRSHDKATRAMDKKSDVFPTTVFVLSAVEAQPMLMYLMNRGAMELHIVVDLEGLSQQEQEVMCMHLYLEDSIVTVARDWGEALGALHQISAETWNQLPQQLGVDPLEAADDELGQSTSGGAAGDAPWTCVWISDQAFKPAAVALKAQLESLGCQVKGYKTNKNAARALDKKRALVRTVVLVIGSEAPPFIAYLASRPEMSNTLVVVEMSARCVPLKESATCKVADGFDSALEVIRGLVSDPGFA